MKLTAVEEEGAEDEGSDAILGPDGALKLGTLDITSTEVSLKGVEDEIERYADHEVLKAILDQGCDPKEFGQQYESQLRQAELESIQDYISESDNLVALHDQICACDGILGTMEEMLAKFQSDLGSISSEIRSLQEQSQSMSLKLRNRKAADRGLASFLDSLALPLPLIQGILAADLDHDFKDHLVALHKKLDFAEKNEAARESAAYRDVAPELEKLRVTALHKCRDFLMTRIYALRKPKTNIQILQQNVLLKYKYLVAFLRQHGREVYAEVRAAYVDTLSRVLSSHFRAYLAALERLQEETVGPHSVIGEAAHGGVGNVVANLWARAGGGPASVKLEAFALGERGALLHHLDQAALLPHVAESEGKRFPFEIIFRSVNKLLMDTATSEYLFCCDFFQEDTVFNELFAPTLAVVEAAFSSQLQELYDLVGVLLMIRINYQHQLIMDKRRIPCLDPYLDRINILLWPRFKVLLDMQLASVKGFNVAGFSEDTRVQPLTQRYATLTTSLLLLNADYQDGQLDQNIDRMRYAVMDLLVRLSQRFSKRRQGTIFLINNFTHVCQMLRDAAAKGSQMVHAPGTTVLPRNAPLGAAGAETIKDFEDQLATCTKLYVEEQLEQHFKEMIHYVKFAEAAAAKAKGPVEGRPIPGYGPAEAAPIVKAFAARWTSAIEAMNKETLADFKVGGVGREVLKATLTQLLLYYTRLLELLKKQGSEGQSLVRDAVTVPSIMYEIKRYSRT